MGQKFIADSDFKAWYARYMKVTTSNDANKEDKLNQLYDEMEKGLEYVGCSAIEDLLQEEVPETIQKLMIAGIRLWVLTGDKQETAIEIGKSCNLINEQEMELIILSSKTSTEFEKTLVHAMNRKRKSTKMSIVIDGSTLTFVLENEQLS